MIVYNGPFNKLIDTSSSHIAHVFVGYKEGTRMPLYVQGHNMLWTKSCYLCIETLILHSVVGTLCY